ncbi:MAG: exodeoxyribonuclease VII large subunit, partial [Actinomycetes bacterium]|nr:exodeoxyribonuclease VII large subunit [Actinomycetes bacterium]MDX5380309.1 exodeoxyribonuclease VII large subunit [Actinomycetes bacterium]MDX5399058.1 exodeoxyribonuclease VII large subunit [Actinomycetes bacterium]MDX5450044.1 exodeoxyribonuclease VII large subunit [Actinomycetes bacterium]
AATAAETTPENPWPLRLLNSKITEYVARMSPLWVEGQLVQINRRPGQPMAFMTLRDADVDMSISLVIQARDLAASTAQLTDGARVVVRAKPTFWPKRGTLQLQASEIRPVGLGELLARIEHLKRVLAAEGLFSADRKRPLPFLPRRVGLICGRESKAEHDVVVNARARWPRVRFEILEVAVQGAHAVAEVCDALATLDADPAIDVIVVARGGGSVEDLLPFSNEHLIRVAAACRTPIISAIGHETDTPLLDLVADQRASTPTDAAKLVVPDVAEERTALAQARVRMRTALTARVTREQTGLTALRSRPVLATPGTVVDRHEERLALARHELRRSFGWYLDRARGELDRLRTQCIALSPAATLERGYAVVRDRAGHVVRDAASVAVGDAVEILLASGRLEADITRTRPGRPAPDPPGG